MQPMNQIHRLKPWKLFLILTFSLFASIFAASSTISIGDFNSLQISIVIRIIGTLIFFSWLLLLGLQLNKIEGNPYHFSNLLFVLAIVSTATSYVEMNLQVLWTDNNPIPFYFGFILMPLTVWGIVYIFSRLPKSLNSIENNKIVKSSEYIKDSLLLFMFPIGVWFIQPRVNAILKDENVIR